MSKLDSNSDWHPPATATIPDFLIAGAMKCGTTTLHSILQSHPQIFIPDDEIHFFDLDDIAAHPDFSHFTGQTWHTPAFDTHREQWWDWYNSLFQGADETQLLGDYSTIYFASPLAAQRIGTLTKPVKVILVLRHPTERSYSEYWHLLRTGRAIYSFEDTLRFEPLRVLHNSLYLDHLQSWLSHVSTAQLRVVLFEDLLSHPGRVAHDICSFLGADENALPEDSLGLHKNIALTPTFPKVQQWKNRLFRSTANFRYIQRGPGSDGFSQGGTLWANRVINALHGKINPLRRRQPPPLQTSTRAYLDEYFEKRLTGIDDLLQENILHRWFGEK